MIGSLMPVFLSKDASIEGSSGCVKVKPDVEVAVVVAGIARTDEQDCSAGSSQRDHWQKPFLHHLQPPPPVNDTNPFNVFRPREKAHRPQPDMYAPHFFFLCLPESGTSQRNSTHHATGVYDFCNSLSWDLSFR
ncbi:unnamed protein product [Sphagnum balticum]